MLTRSIYNPDPRAMVKLKRVMTYLKGAIKMGLTYKADADGGGTEAYVDAYYAGDKEKGSPATGIVLFYEGAPLIWGLKLQTVVTLSSTEAEYVALSKARHTILHIHYVIFSRQQSKTRLQPHQWCGGTINQLSRRLAVNKIKPNTSMLSTMVDAT